MKSYPVIPIRCLRNKHCDKVIVYTYSNIQVYTCEYMQMYM